MKANINHARYQETDVRQTYHAGKTVLFIKILKIYTKDQYIFVKIVKEKAISEVHCHQKIISWILTIKLATSAKKSNTSTASMLR